MGHRLACPRRRASRRGALESLTYAGRAAPCVHTARPSPRRYRSLLMEAVLQSAAAAGRRGRGASVPRHPAHRTESSRCIGSFRIPFGDARVVFEPLVASSGHPWSRGREVAGSRGRENAGSRGRGEVARSRGRGEVAGSRGRVIARSRAREVASSQGRGVAASSRGGGVARWREREVARSPCGGVEWSRGRKIAGSRDREVEGSR